MTEWRDFYAMAAQALAALTGLLFVGMSLHLKAILVRPALSHAIGLGLGALIAELLLCGFMLVPDVGPQLAGIAVAAVGLVFVALYGLAAWNVGGMRTNLLVSMVFTAAGVALALGVDGAAYVVAALIGLTAAALVALSWRLLTASILD